MLNVIEKVLLLQDLDFFQFAYTEHLAQLASICREAEVGEQIVLFREGEECKRFHLLISGQVTLEREEVVVDSVEHGALGTWAFFSESTHRFTATAATDCRILTVSFEEMADLLTAEPEFCWAVLKYLARLGREAETSPRTQPHPPSREAGRSH
jgi:CRP-like cAMP-binding protein